MARERGRGAAQGPGVQERLNMLLDGALTMNDWEAAIRAVMNKAKEGDLQALRLLLAYRFGLPPRMAQGVEDERVRLTLYLPREGELAAQQAGSSRVERAVGTAQERPAGER